ncbi:hypothetical protein ACVMGC_001005 [Bradyrhizobium barranii subsp. barranii]|uniref:DUF4376 domain-containing protein n=1 Tax=Bradyrhizobium liaoningense TaxID=43992 RepID=UPI001BA74C33|nr:DUF4376 domain-containing protein [Bradyrhizobium liaoningense]MBR0879607.1 DUF4376 domain-containing protein [Bradyrhizobium liaoningense]
MPEFPELKPEPPPKSKSDTLDLKVDVEQAGIFSARLLARDPKCTPLYDGAKFIIPKESAKLAQEVFDAGLKPSKDELMTMAAGARFDREVAGVTVNGVQIATDRDSVARINFLFNLAINDKSFKTFYKVGPGHFVPLDAPAIIKIATAVGKHVTDSYAAEAKAAGSIATGAMTTRKQVDAVIMGKVAGYQDDLGGEGRE